MKKKFKFVLLFLLIFIFHLLYFLLLICIPQINSLFLILAIFMVLICIFLYRMLSTVIKESNTEIELSFLQKQKHLEQEQEDSLQIRKQDTLNFQTKTIQKLMVFQSFLEQGMYKQADAAIKDLNQTFQKERFHPYCQNNLLQAILEGKRIRAEQNHIQVSYEILLPENLSIATTDISSIFFNLLDNAIEATAVLPDHSKKEIRVFVEVTEPQMIVSVTNPVIKDINVNHLKTTKNDSQNHGYGLLAVRRIADKYNGTLLLDCQNNTFGASAVLNQPE